MFEQYNHYKIWNENRLKVIFRNEEGFDQAYENIGSQPSIGMIEKIILDSGKNFERIDDKDLNSDFHHYDWIVTEDLQWVTGRRKFWIIK